MYFDVGSQHGTNFLMLECLDGEPPLDERQRESPMPVDELAKTEMQGR